MADKLNSMKVRLCAVVWDLVDLEFIDQRRAATILERIEGMAFWEVAELFTKLLPVNHRSGFDFEAIVTNGRGE